MAVITHRIIHEVDEKGKLYFLLNGFNVAINKLAEQLGGGLRAIALALSTPQDNSAEVQKQIDHLETQLKWQTDALKSTVDQTKGE